MNSVYNTYKLKRDSYVFTPILDERRQEKQPYNLSEEDAIDLINISAKNLQIGLQ